MPHAPTGSGPSMIATAIANVGHNMFGGRNGNHQNGLDPSVQNATTSTDSTALPDLEGKDIPEQIEILSSCIEVEIRIRDGAERILQVIEIDNTGGKENLRKMVGSQLDNARAKIAWMTNKLDQLKSSATSSRSRKKPGALVNGKRTVFTHHVQIPSPTSLMREDPPDKDDFRTALAQANNLIQTLSSYHGGRSNTDPFSSGSLQSVGMSITGSSASGGTTTTHVSDIDVDRARISVMTALVNVLQRNFRLRYELDTNELITVILPGLADYASKESRAAAYRVLRHMIVDLESVQKLNSYGIDYYLIRSLCRDNKHAVEKEQAIKLIRAYVEVGSSRRTPTAGVGTGTIPISDDVMRAFICVAEYADDQFRHIALETLVEMILIDIDIVSRTDGLRVVLQAMVDGPHELAPVLATAFLYIIDAPRTRAYLRAGLDIEVALSGFTDAYGKGAAHAERMKSSSRVISTMLRTWSGLMYLCMNNMQGVRSLINTLRIPSLDTREVILDLFFEVLNIDTPSWYKAYIDGRRLTMIDVRKSMLHANKDLGDSWKEAPERLNLTHQYLALLLLVFIEAGILEALIGILEENSGNQNLQRKSTLLLGELLQIANNVLPLSIAARIQSLPRLFSLAADFGHNSEFRTVATTTLASIDSYNRNRSKLQKPLATVPRPRANSLDESLRRVPRQVDQVKSKPGVQVDDKVFQTMLVDTQVVTQKDHTKWNLETVMEIIEGPMLNPKRMEEAVKGSRFGKKLMSFFHPSSNRFSTLPRSLMNEKYIRMGCSLLTTLISCAEGIRFLRDEDTLLKEIVHAFHQLDQYPLESTPDITFAENRVQRTLSYGYLEMIGTLARSPEGIELLEKFKVFTALYRVTDLGGRQDLVKAIIENLDYSTGGHSRIILSKALTSFNQNVRIYATQHLGNLIRTSPKANEWTLRLLLTQLYDPELEVCELAVQYLEEACENMDVLEMVVQMQPTLDHLGEIGHPLLLRFMSTPVGFRYLYKADYINREMESWFHERNYQYVVQVEVFLAQALSTTVQRDEDQEFLVFEGTVPPHFYGEMTKTELGCQVLSAKGHFTEYADFIRQHGLESEDFDLIIKLKSVLWAVGNIGSTTGGLPFLEEEGIIPEILNIAESSLVMSVRGTAFFVLGLVSSTPQGAEILDEYDWEATLTPLGQTTGLCIPLDVENFVRIPDWEPANNNAVPRRLPPPENAVERQVVSAISNLQNTVIANEAARSLTKLKAQNRRLFSSPSLFYRALFILATQRYRLPVRRYILDLFDVDLDQDSVAQLLAISRSLQVQPMRPKLKSASNSETIGLGVSSMDEVIAIDVDSGQGSFESHQNGLETTQPAAAPMKPLVKVAGFEA